MDHSVQGRHAHSVADLRGTIIDLPSSQTWTWCHSPYLNLMMPPGDRCGSDNILPIVLMKWPRVGDTRRFASVSQSVNSRGITCNQAFWFQTLASSFQTLSITTVIPTTILPFLSWPLQGSENHFRDFTINSKKVKWWKIILFNSIFRLNVTLKQMHVPRSMILSVGLMEKRILMNVCYVFKISEYKLKCLKT